MSNFSHNTNCLRCFGEQENSTDTKIMQLIKRDFFSNKRTVFFQGEREAKLILVYDFIFHFEAYCVDTQKWKSYKWLKEKGKMLYLWFHLVMQASLLSCGLHVLASRSERKKGCPCNACHWSMKSRVFLNPLQAVYTFNFKVFFTMETRGEEFQKSFFFCFGCNFPWEKVITRVIFGGK